MAIAMSTHPTFFRLFVWRSHRKPFWNVQTTANVVCEIHL